MEPAPRAAVFDLDGTLAESKQPMDAAMGALLARLLEQMPVAVMSGANTPQFEAQFLPGLPAQAAVARLYLFPTSGASCLSYTKGAWEPVYENALTAEEKQEVLGQLAAALQSVGLETPPARLWGERIEDRGGQISFSALGQQAPVDEKRAWHKTFDPMRQQLRKELEDRLPDFSVKAGGLTTVDITKKGIDKAYGLRRFSEITGVPVEQMLYIGDALFPGGNDAVVIETGVQTRQVAGPEETARCIAMLLSGRA